MGATGALGSFKPAAEHAHAGVLGLLGHRVRSLGHVGPFLLGKGHRAATNEIRYCVIV